jgi:hypothetical protein
MVVDPGGIVAEHPRKRSRTASKNASEEKRKSKDLVIIFMSLSQETLLYAGCPFSCFSLVRGANIPPTHIQHDTERGEQKPRTPERKSCPPIFSVKQLQVSVLKSISRIYGPVPLVNGRNSSGRAGECPVPACRSPYCSTGIAVKALPSPFRGFRRCALPPCPFPP